MNAPDIDRLVDAATEGLKGDRELRLDVRAELMTHIEEAIESHRSEGVGEQESVSEALKAFGPANDIAAELVSANKSRMRFRQIVTLAMRALLIPASLLVALWVLSEGLYTHRLAGMVWSLAAISGPSVPSDQSVLLSRSGLSEEADFLFFGDRSLDTELERQRSIWAKDPTNRVFYGNYITRLVADHGHDKGKDAARLHDEIRRGQELDPDNARYDLLLASLLAGEAAELEVVENDDGTEEHVLRIHSREQLDEAMAGMLKGLAKPFMDSYAVEMQAQQFAALPEERTMLELIGRISHMAGMLLPDISRHRDLARIAPEYAGLLIDEGKKDEAIPYLEAWQPLSKMSFEASGTLIETLVAFAVVRTGSNSVEVLEAIGEVERAADMQKTMRPVNEVFSAWRSRIRQDDAQNDVVRKYGSFLHALLLPALGGEAITEKSLAYGRYLEHTLLEKGWLVGFTLHLLVVMVGFATLAVSLKFIRGGESAPILLLPDGAQSLRVIVYAVIIPLTVFYIYTRHTDLAGRQYSMRQWPRFLIELHVLTVIMISVAVFHTQRLVRMRCIQLKLATPPSLRYWQLFLLSLVPIALVAWTGVGRRKTALFRGTVARSLVPVVALILVLDPRCPRHL